MSLALASIFRFATIAIKTLLVLAVVLAAIAYWNWLRGQDREFRSFRTTLLSAATATSLTTSFARVDVFRVLDQQGRWHPVNSFGANVDPQRLDLQKIKAFCSRTYDVTLGYPQLREDVAKATGAGPFPLPQLLAINTISASDWGRESAAQCLGRFEGDSTRAMLKDALVTDGLWELHVKNGAQALASASHRVLPQCPEGQACERQTVDEKLAGLLASNDAEFQHLARCFGEPQVAQSAACEAARARVSGATGVARSELPKGEHSEFLLAAEDLARGEEKPQPVKVFGLDRSQGYEGTIVLTLSALATMGNERRVRFLWVIPLWLKEAFYFRREIAEITFGTHVGEHALHKSRVPFFGPRLVFSVADARVIGINRRVVAQGYSGDLRELERAGSSLSNEANQGILAGLQTAVAGYTRTAQAMSRTILRDRYETDDVRVEFHQQRDDANATVFLTGS